MASSSARVPGARVPRDNTRIHQEVPVGRAVSGAVDAKDGMKNRTGYETNSPPRQPKRPVSETLQAALLYIKGGNLEDYWFEYRGLVGR